MIDAFIRKIRARHALSAEEEQALRGAKWALRRFERHQTMVRAGQELDSSMLIVGGFALRAKLGGEGTRQIVEINLVGDFTDLHSFLLKRLDHDIVAASRCEVATIAHSELRRLSDQLPRLARVLWFQTLIDASIHREWMLALGKKRSRARIAQLFCEMHIRLGLVGLTNGDRYSLPFNQVEMSDITGMTSVHLNRCLRELREAKLVAFRSGEVEILDPAGLAAAALFDPGYLHLGPHEI